MLALDRQEHELAHDAEHQGETAGLAVHAEAFCRRVREGLAGANFDRKRALLELLIDRVIVIDGVVAIRYVVPTGPDGCKSAVGLDADQGRNTLDTHISPRSGICAD